jgi:hypothetical protein
VLDALNWSGRGEFFKSKRKDFWVWNKDVERGELAGYINEGGGLTFALVILKKLLFSRFYMLIS